MEPEVHYRVHKSPKPAPILSQINSFHPILSLKSILILSTHLHLGLSIGKLVLLTESVLNIQSMSHCLWRIQISSPILLLFHIILASTYICVHIYLGEAEMGRGDCCSCRFAEACHFVRMYENVTTFAARSFWFYNGVSVTERWFLLNQFMLTVKLIWNLSKWNWL
jgi:hypothetical protein